MKAVSLCVKLTASGDRARLINPLASPPRSGLCKCNSGLSVLNNNRLLNSSAKLHAYSRTQKSQIDARNTKNVIEIAYIHFPFLFSNSLIEEPMHTINSDQL